MEATKLQTFIKIAGTKGHKRPKFVKGEEREAV